MDELRRGTKKLPCNQFFFEEMNYPEEREMKVYHPECSKDIQGDIIFRAF